MNNVEQQQAVSAILSAPKSIAYNRSSEKMKVDHSETKPTQIAPSFTFEHLHGCTVNINAPPSHGNTASTTTVTDHMELDIDKLASIIINSKKKHYLLIIEKTIL